LFPQSTVRQKPSSPARGSVEHLPVGAGKIKRRPESKAALEGQIRSGGFQSGGERGRA
jgi:hypothetical protein